MMHKPILALVAVVLLITGLVTNVAYAQAPVTTVVKVTANDLETETDRFVAAESSNKWFFYNDENDTIDNSLGSFVTGPGTPPAGGDSAQISVTGTERRNLATYQFRSTPLANITTLAFSTYNPSAGNGGSANSSGYLHFNVDFDGSDTWQRRLIFLPSDNGTIQQNTWQEWDSINGGNSLWRYSGATWPGTAIAGSTARTWNDILTSYSGARIRVTDAFLGIRVGEPYQNGYTENIDAFKFGTAAGTTVYDFGVLTAADLMDNLQADTASMVTNAAARQALLNTLNRAEMYMNANRPLLAYLTMLQYMIQVERYQDSRRISAPVAWELLVQARDMTRTIMSQ
jgi:hypothetical protein